MDNIKEQQTGIEILAEITKKELERHLQIQDIKNVNANWTPRHGWHLKKTESSKVWQDNK